MTEPDFSEITGDADNEQGSSTTSSKRTSAKTTYVKGQYGTTQFDNTDGCRVCDRNADAVLLVGVGEDGDKGMRDGDVLVCDSHEGDVRGDLEYDHTRVQRVDF